MMDTSQRTIASHRNAVALTSKTHRAEGTERCPLLRGRHQRMGAIDSREGAGRSLRRHPICHFSAHLLCFPTMA